MTSIFNKNGFHCSSFLVSYVNFFKFSYVFKKQKFLKNKYIFPTFFGINFFRSWRHFPHEKDLLRLRSSVKYNCFEKLYKPGRLVRLVLFGKSCRFWLKSWLKQKSHRSYSSMNVFKKFKTIYLWNTSEKLLDLHPFPKRRDIL